MAKDRRLASIDDQLTRFWATYRNWVRGETIGMSPLVAYETLDLLLDQRRDLGAEMRHQDDVASVQEWGSAG